MDYTLSKDSKFTYKIRNLPHTGSRVQRFGTPSRDLLNP